MIFSYFKDKNGIKNTSKSVSITLEKAIEIIKSDEYKEVIGKIRTHTDKSVRQVLKKSLAYFCFSGTFKNRSEAGLEKHSNLIQIDFDDLENVEEAREKLAKDPYTRSLFRGPSGNGWKVIVQIDGTQHLASFFWLEGYYLHTYGLKIDQSCKDIPRACYVSYDPDAIIKLDSKTPELPSEDVKFDPDSGEVYPDREKLPEDKERQFKTCEAYVCEIERLKIDITFDYQDWLVIGFCMATFGEEGRSLFHRISAMSEKYTERDCNEKFNNALRSTRFTSPAKFIKICKSYSIKVKVPKNEKPASPKGVPLDENTEWQYYDSRHNTILELTEQQKKEVHKYRILELNNIYYEAKKFSSKEMLVDLIPFSNFVIRPLFLVISKNDPKRVIEIENIYGVRKTLDIPSKAFTSQQEFNVFVESQGNFLFTEKTPPFHLVKVKIWEATTNADEVKTLGWNNKAKAYIFANGAFYENRFIPIDDHGILTINPKPKTENEKTTSLNFFLPALSDIYRDSDESFENEKKFIYIRRPEIKFEDWAKLLVKVHGDNGMMGLMFYLSAIFSDIIYAKFKFFPQLFLFGLSGSGKSTLAWSLQALFGIGQTPYQLHAGTQVGLARLFANFRNALVWCDEYKNDLDSKKREFLKGVYDRTGHIKGIMDNSNKTTITPVLSACIISGQELPIADIALFKRQILLQFDVTERTEEEKENLKALQALEQGGLSHLTAPMMMFREIVERDFMAEFDQCNKDIMPHLAEVNESRLIQNMLIPLAMYKLTANRLIFPFTYDELSAFAIATIKSQNNLVSHSKETSVFWDLVMYMISQNMIREGEDYKVHHSFDVSITVEGKTQKRTFKENTPILYISMQRVHPLYMDLHRKTHNKNGMDKSSIAHYLTSQKSFVGVLKSFRFNNDRVTSAYLFYHSDLAREGYDFEKHLTDLPDDHERKDYPQTLSEENEASQLSIGEEVPF